MNLTIVKLLFVIIFLIHYSPNLVAQDGSVKDTIRAVFAEQQKSWNSGDIPAFMETYWKSDKLVFLSDSGPVYGWQNTLARYNSKYPDRQAMGYLDFDIQKVEKNSKKVYSVIGKYHLTRNDLDDLNGYFLIIVEKKKGNWVIVADSTH